MPNGSKRKITRDIRKYLEMKTNKQTNKQNIYIYNMLKLIRYTKAVLKGKFIPINAHI
jgi:hypothetical protein